MICNLVKDMCFTNCVTSNDKYVTSRHVKFEIKMARIVFIVLVSLSNKNDVIKYKLNCL